MFLRFKFERFTAKEYSVFLWILFLAGWKSICTYWKTWETPGRTGRCLNDKLLTPKLDKCAKKTRFIKNRSQIWQIKTTNVRKQDISLSMSWGQSERVIERAIAAAVSQKSSRRPGEEFKKGKGRRQVIYLKTSVSDNDVMLSSTSRPASLWDEGMSRTAPDTRLRLCPGIRRGSAINFLLSFIYVR